ncbi:hypothetical protein LJR168_001608 [Pseudoxanthomonas sp. LjRoot168]|uniref:hypothetical protein n=1 Tax=unclassified Pseudoxanthomonas TaxID=2645906 RepID=UPI003ECEBB03
MANTVDRLLALKVAIFRTQRTEFVAPDLASVFRKAKNAALPVEDKHYPPIADLKKGKRGAFVNKITDLGKDRGVIIEVCTYLHGVFPETGKVPLGKSEIDLDAVQLAAAKKGIAKKAASDEALYRFRVLLFGKAVIVEKAGNTSAVQVLPHLLKTIIRNVLKDPKHPVPHLVNVGSERLDSIIASKGGVDKVVASILVPKVKSTNKFAKLLSGVRKGIRGADKVQISWSSDDSNLNEKDVDAIFDEFEDEEAIDNVKIVFPGGTSVTDLSQYREQERYTIGADMFGRPYANEVHEALVHYSIALRNPKKKGPLNVDGDLRDGYYLAGSDDED